MCSAFERVALDRETLVTLLLMKDTNQYSEAVSRSTVTGHKDSRAPSRH